MLKFGFMKSSERLTKVEFTFYRNIFYSNMKGALENETDADGGDAVPSGGYFTYTSLIAGPTGENTLSTATSDLSSVYIPWSNRYNYRLGMCGHYKIVDIKLYKDGVLTETQSAINENGGTNTYAFHWGINLNPSNRNKTSANVAGTDNYLK